jgi:hypothetical protein
VVEKPHLDIVDIVLEWYPERVGDIDCRYSDRVARLGRVSKSRAQRCAHDGLQRRERGADAPLDVMGVLETAILG